MSRNMCCVTQQCSPTVSTRYTCFRPSPEISEIDCCPQQPRDHCESGGWAPPMSKIAWFATGHGNCTLDPRAPKTSKCCKPKENRDGICCEKTVCIQQPPPQVCVIRTREEQRCPCPPILDKVDVQEELCYDGGSNDAETSFDCYEVCDCCGTLEYKCSDRRDDCDEEKGSNPVKYIRRQRFHYKGSEGGQGGDGCCSKWPFDDKDVDGCCGGKGKRARMTQRCNERRSNVTGCCEDSSSSSSGKKCKDKGAKKGAKRSSTLPENTGIYYFNKHKNKFIAEEDLPTEVVFKDVPQKKKNCCQQQCCDPCNPCCCPPPPPPSPPEPIHTYQSVIQPVVVPQPQYVPIYYPVQPPPQPPPPPPPPPQPQPCPPPCNPRQPPCNPCCKPPCNPCNPCNSPCNPCGPPNCLTMCMPMCSNNTSCGPPRGGGHRRSSYGYPGEYSETEIVYRYEDEDSEDSEDTSDED